MTDTHTTSRRILVAGGAGFLGFHLCQRLLRDGHEVICLDNFQTGSRDNLRPLAEYGNFSVIEHDVIEPITGHVALDRIFNLACPASPNHYQADPVRTTMTCVSGSFNLLELARRTKARYLQASTSEVYGDPLVHPQVESYRGNVNPVGRRACYDEGKRCAEALCSDFERHKGVTVKIARIFNTYGPRMALHDGRVVSNFAVQGLCGKRLTVFGTGAQTRSLCYVDDMVEGLIRLMDSSDLCRGPVNLGNPREITILELAGIMRSLTGTPAELNFQPLPADDPRQRCPDISAARRHLGWEPAVSLEEGLRITVRYFSEQLHARAASA